MKQRKAAMATAVADDSEGSARDVGGSAQVDTSVMGSNSSNAPPIPTTASESNDDNSFLPVPQESAQAAGIVSHLNATIENDVEIDFTRPEYQRQVSLSDSDLEFYHDEGSQSTSYEDELRSFDSQESYQSDQSSRQDEPQEHEDVLHRSNMIAVGIPAPTINYQDSKEEEDTVEQGEEANPRRSKTRDEVDQEAISESIAQGIAEAEHIRKCKTRGDSSKHKMVARTKGAGLKSDDDSDLKKHVSLKSQLRDDPEKKYRTWIRSLIEGEAKKQEGGHEVFEKTVLTYRESFVYGTRRTREGLIDDDDEDDGEDLEAQAGIPVVMPGAFAMEGMDAAPGRQVTGYDSGFDNSDSESDVGQPPLRRQSTRHSVLSSVAQEDEPPLELEGELHQEPELVDGLAISDDDLVLEEIKTPVKVRVVQASIFFCTLVAIGVIISLVIVLAGSRSSDTDENILVGWDAVGEPLLPTQIDRDGSYFGSAVSLSSNGSRLAVASPGWDDPRSPSRLDIGQVLVYDWSGMNWELVGQELNGPGPRTTMTGSLSLSQTIALSGDGKRVAFGSPDWNGGQVAILQEPTTTDGKWSLVGQNITGPEGDSGRFGYSVAISSRGDAVAIGAPFASNIRGDTAAGIVRVYRESTNSTWTQVGQGLMGEGSYELHGWSVAISSNASLLAVGSPGSGIVGDFTGAVQVFRMNDIGWTQLGRTIRGDSIQDKFGHCVSFSDDGTVLAVGGWEKPDVTTGAIYAGHVRVYKYDEDLNDWDQIGNDLVGTDSYDNFGYSVALSSNGMKVAVGSPRTNSISGGFASRGRIDVFDFDGSEWRKQGGTITSTQDFENLGHAVAVSAYSSRVAGGAPGAGFDSKYNNVGKVGLVQPAS